MGIRQLTLAVLVFVLASAGMPGATQGLVAQGEPAADRGALQQRIVAARNAVLGGTGRPNEVIGELQAILAIDPALAEPHVLLALAYRAIGSNAMLAEAIAEFRQALAIDPRMAAARLYLANAYLELGRAERAREELELALAQIPGQPQFTTALAEAERRAGNPERGLQLALQVIAVNPGANEARYYAAMCLIDLKRQSEAVPLLEQLLQTGPVMGNVPGSLGALYLDEGRLDDAVRTLTLATQVSPSRPDFHVLLARALRMRGSLAEAEQQLARALPPGAALEASEFYETAAADIHLERGRIRLLQSRTDEGIAELVEAAKLRPLHGETHRDLAEAYLRQGRTDLATEHAGHARAAGAVLSSTLSGLLPASP